jgi:hypothetical protein
MKTINTFLLLALLFFSCGKGDSNPISAPISIHQVRFVVDSVGSNTWGSIYYSCGDTMDAILLSNVSFPWIKDFNVKSGESFFLQVQANINSYSKYFRCRVFIDGVVYKSGLGTYEYGYHVLLDGKIP